MNADITARRISSHTKRRYLAYAGLIIGVALACVDITTQGGLSAWSILIILGSALDIAYESNQIRALKKMEQKT